jgi:hypothetical protein
MSARRPPVLKGMVNVWAEDCVANDTSRSVLIDTVELIQIDEQGGAWQLEGQIFGGTFHLEIEITEDKQ